MSYFYLRPRLGVIRLHQIEEGVLVRRDLMRALADGTPPVFSEHLVEGGGLDNVGHFFLGLLTRSAGDAALKALVDDGEAALFDLRLRAAGTRDIRRLLKSIIDEIKQVEESERPTHLEALMKLSRKAIVKPVAEHTFAPDHRTDCSTFELEVPFTQCLPFIAGRRVELKGGIAKVSCGLWKQFLRSLFVVHNRTKFEDIGHNFVSDPRWREIASRLAHTSASKGTLRSKQIDEEASHFPPCMQYLHGVLRRRHRLGHDDRFRYGLFLKDAGLPIQEALQFWQNEYSKPADGGSCGHSWTKDERKFVYGIRHLYGLEGARKDYRMPACRGLQSRTDGGCAFRHFDDAHLEKMRHPKINQGDWERILTAKRAGQCSRACSMYRDSIVGREEKSGDIHSPVDYYKSINLLVKNQNSNSNR